MSGGELTLYSSFTGGTLARLGSSAGLSMHAAPLDAIETDEAEGPAFLWATAEAISPAFAAAMDFSAIDPAEVLHDTAAFAGRLKRHAASRPALYVASLVPARLTRGLGPLDLTHEAGIKRLLMQMNLALADALAGAPNIILLNADRWLAQAGPAAFQPKHWYVAKIPFTDAVFRAALSDVAAAARARAGKARKLIITDLDDTLWGGILGEVGWEKLRLGGHDHIGEMHRDLQLALKAWSRTGIQLAILSKNDETNALHAINTHPEMVLREEDFAGWRIDWNDKAANLTALMDELRLGLDSAVFLDDNPVERDRIRQVFPDVHVPDLPADKMLWPGIARTLDLFDRTVLSAEDRTRTQMYAAERQRTRDSAEAGSREEWLASLETRITAAALDAANMTRAVQLLNKTNQMNLATRRLGEKELQDWLRGGAREFWTFTVEDRFGASGLTALLGLDFSGPGARITDFVMSCRVIGRDIENALLGHAAARARAHGAASLAAELVPTQRNTPCREFFETRSGFTETAPGVFSWNVSVRYPVPATLELIDRQPTFPVKEAQA
ncbi:HAD-IIIC family phosphatase [Tepidicaulis sp. LMO-SS28]|uniref:HAD-IIIC family phosphatase n=1 Tax=Tepidicaulis sp. LMO-SS28 TaxID=3447455 RepID=UPI003EE18698